MLYPILSPAKKLDFTPQDYPLECHKPALFKYSKQLLSELQKYSSTDLAKLMKLSPSLAELNYQRFQKFSSRFTHKNSKPAITAFNGETYVGLAANNFSTKDFKYAQKVLRILSGFYGMLTPSDLIQPYRLEMGTSLTIGEKKNLYQFWKDIITTELQELLTPADSILVNLASDEYFKVIDQQQLSVQIITPVFKKKKDGQLKSIGMMSKRARGMMANFIITQRLTKPEQLHNFQADGFKYHPADSTSSKPLFIKQ